MRRCPINATAPRDYTPVYDDPWPVERRTGYPVDAVDFAGNVLASYPSMAAAVGDVGGDADNLKRNADRGTFYRGYWWRYADMPVLAQPLQPRRAPKPRRDRRHRAVTVYGMPFPTIADAARAMGMRPGSLWQRLKRHGHLRRPARWDVDVAMCATA